MQSFIPHSQKRRWMLLYEMAMSEIDDDKRLDLIALAKGAIFQRQQELADSKLAHIDELAALDDALYILAAFRKAAKFNRGQRQLGAG